MLLTETHRPEVPSEQRRISEVGGFVNNKRVNGKIIILGRLIFIKVFCK